MVKKWTKNKIPPKKMVDLHVTPVVLPPIELEEMRDEGVIENRNLPSKETSLKVELQTESEAQRSPEVRVGKIPDVCELTSKDP